MGCNQRQDRPGPKFSGRIVALFGVRYVPNSNDWDKHIDAHCTTWINAIESLLGLRESNPGRRRQESWVTEAKGGTGREILNLDFFKFNMAVKVHYQFVKQQMLLHNIQMIDKWTDGRTLVDDLSSFRKPTTLWQKLINETLTACIQHTPSKIAKWDLPSCWMRSP
jgi:hypothetical protein